MLYSGRLWPYMRLDWKDFPGTNDLAYYKQS